MPALHLLLLARGHAVVAEIIEAKLRIHPVADVRAILLAAFIRRLVVLDDADSEAEVLVELPHPFRVASGEVIVRGDEVRAVSREAVQKERQRGDKRLALAGRHLGDHALVQAIAADELRVEMNHRPRHRLLADGKLRLRFREPPRGILHRGKRLRQNVIEVFLLRAPFERLQLFLPFRDLRAQGILAERAEFHLELIDARDDRLERLDHACVFRAEEFFEDPGDWIHELY